MQGHEGVACGQTAIQFPTKDSFHSNNIHDPCKQSVRCLQNVWRWPGANKHGYRNSDQRGQSTEEYVGLPQCSSRWSARRSPALPAGRVLAHPLTRTSPEGHAE